MSPFVNFLPLGCGFTAIAVFAIVLAREPAGLLVLSDDRGHIDVSKPALRSGNCMASFGLMGCGESHAALATGYSTVSLSNPKGDVVNARRGTFSIDDIVLNTWGLHLDVFPLSRKWRHISLDSSIALWEGDSRRNLEFDGFNLEGGRYGVSLRLVMLEQLQLRYSGDEYMEKWLTLASDPYGGSGSLELGLDTTEVRGDTKRWVWPAAPTPND